MNKIAKPSFTLGYWKPFDENQNFYDSYQLYIRDVSLQKYNAEIIGSYIEKSNKDTFQAIYNSAKQLGYELEVAKNHLSNISFSLKSMLYETRLFIEQQKATNILLHDIKELMRLPDSERERLYAIELGLKFFSSANKDKDLFGDALNEFLKAESLMAQDYFVLHRIGLIYLLVKDHINIPLALEYFKKAAKYASVESNLNIKTLAYLSTDQENYSDVNTRLENSNDYKLKRTAKDNIKKMASESFEKAAFASYVLGDIPGAITLQQKALNLFKSAQNHFFLAKYLVRSGKSKDALLHLNSAIETLPDVMELIIKDLDLNTIPVIIKWANKKADFVNNKINYLMTQWKNSKSPERKIQVTSLSKLLSQNYAERVYGIQKSEKDLKNYINIEKESKKQLTKIYNKVKEMQFLSKEIDKDELLSVIQNFKLNKNPMEMDNLHTEISELIIEENRIQQVNSYKKYKKKIEREELITDIWGIFLGLVFGGIWIIPAFTMDESYGIVTSFLFWTAFLLGEAFFLKSERVKKKFAIVFFWCTCIWFIIWVLSYNF